MLPLGLTRQLSAAIYTQQHILTALVIIRALNFWPTMLTVVPLVHGSFGLNICEKVYC